MRKIVQELVVPDWNRRANHGVLLPLTATPTSPLLFMGCCVACYGACCGRPVLSYRVRRSAPRGPAALGLQHDVVAGHRIGLGESRLPCDLFSGTGVRVYQACREEREPLLRPPGPVSWAASTLQSIYCTVQNNVSSGVAIAIIATTPVDLIVLFRGNRAMHARRGISYHARAAAIFPIPGTFQSPFDLAPCHFIPFHLTLSHLMLSYRMVRPWMD